MINIGFCTSVCYCEIHINIKSNITEDEGNRELVSRDYYDAYAQREDMSRKDGDKFYQHVQHYCLEQIVEECYHQSRKGQLINE